METIRRFLILTPVAYVVTALVHVPAMVTGSLPLGPTGFVLLLVLAVVVGVLAVILVVAGLLRLLRVRNEWAVLGVAFALVAVVLVLGYLLIGTPLLPVDGGWKLLYVVGPAVVSLPAWIVYAVGLLVWDLWNRRAGKAAA